MKIWPAICLVSLGVVLGHSGGDAFDARADGVWGPIAGVSALIWGWSALASRAQSLGRRLSYVLTGRAPARPTTDPKALADEMAALNAQVAQLRDTATSFDVSFDQTLQRLDERLRRVEQQAPYVQPTIQTRPGG